MRKYTPTHEWIEIKGNRLVKIGITKAAVAEIGKTVFVGLPMVGSQMQAQEAACVLESSKAAVEVTSPLSGTVVAVNSQLETDPDLLNRDPEGQGWLYQLELLHPDEIGFLLDQETL